MNKLIAIAALIVLRAVPASAGALPRDIIGYDELMVMVPHLESVGYSRISTVEFCAEVIGAKDWTNLITDSELEGMEACLIEHT